MNKKDQVECFRSNALPWNIIVRSIWLFWDFIGLFFIVSIGISLILLTCIIRLIFFSSKACSCLCFFWLWLFLLGIRKMMHFEVVTCLGCWNWTQEEWVWVCFWVDWRNTLSECELWTWLSSLMLCLMSIIKN